jgi:hypothetical protein
VPGAAVGIVDGDAELLEVFAVTNISNPMAVDERTLFKSAQRPRPSLRGC